MDDPKFIDDSAKGRMAVNFVKHLLEKSGYDVYDFGIETQVTVWGYETESPIKNTIFRKYKLINKSSVDIKEMYTGIFSDATANTSSKTYAGCDSTLGLGYAYYPEQTDFLYGVNPPALGFKYLQGPLIDGSSTDYAFKNGKKIEGKKNLNATSFVFIKIIMVLQG